MNYKKIQSFAEGGQVRDPSSHRTPGQIKRMDRGYNATDENIKKRSQRNQARAIVRKEVGDAAMKGKDVDHKRPVRSGGSNSRSNLRLIGESRNRGWRDGKV